MSKTKFQFFCNLKLCRLFSIVTFSMTSLFAENNFYDSFFQPSLKTQYNDTMFERVLWQKKVSHLVMETVADGYLVTLLVIPESPYNFKSQAYPLHYRFGSYENAFKKFLSMDQFLKSGGILKVTISGSNIIGEKILKDGKSSD
ncbi:MAG: hypothetical protein OEV66_03505 [Spirochaetia bacterium]|nr:hypothetical protein [Spirochaetia bacterium]